MLTRAEARRQRKELMRDIRRDERGKARDELARLVGAVREARASRRQALRDAVERCRALRLQARERVKELRREALAILAQQVAEERANAKVACVVGVAAAEGLSGRTAQARAKLAAEQEYRRSMRQIERGNVQRRRELAARGRRRGERREESDDEVAASLPPELLALWEREKRGIKASAHRSRLEAFLQYAEENPHEVLEAMGDRTDALVRELAEQERQARKELRRRRAAADVPF